MLLKIQPTPRLVRKSRASPAEIIRCVLESLALHYRKIFHETEILTGSRFGGCLPAPARTAC